MEDENSSSSLFYSCLSATAFEEQEGRCGDAKYYYENREGDPKIDSSSNKVETRQSNPIGHENINKISTAENNSENTNTAINPPSSANSSWSVLSESERPIVRSITFNRDRTCLIASTTVGVRIRTLESLQWPLKNLHDCDNARNAWMHDVPLPPDGATYAQLLHNTSLLAAVQPSSPRCCHLYNAKNSSSPLATLPLSAAVKRVELQRIRGGIDMVLVAMTVDLRLHVFHMTDGGGDVQQYSARSRSVEKKKKLRPTLITTLNIYHPSDSPRNVTRGLDGFNAGSYFDLSTNESAPYLVCKSFNGTPGAVRVYDPTTVHSTVSPSSDASVGGGSARSIMSSSWDKYSSPPGSQKIKRRIQLLTTIEAHNHSVTRMLIGGGGKDQQTLLATASSKGTNIKVFGLPKGDLLWAWHRGSKSCQFYSLSWNGLADRLATYGSSGTIHIFDLKEKKMPSDILEGDNCDDDSRDFSKVYEEFREFDDFATKTAGSKPLLWRIGSSIRRRASSNCNDSRHRSMAKLKYRPSVIIGTGEPGAARQSMVLSLLDRNHSEDGKNVLVEREDTLVLCSMDGELRQYSVKTDGNIGLIQIEDVLTRR